MGKINKAYRRGMPCEQEKTLNLGIMGISAKVFFQNRFDFFYWILQMKLSKAQRLNEHLDVEHRHDSGNEGIGGMFLKAMAMGLGYHFVADYIEHRTAGECCESGQQGL